MSLSNLDSENVSSLQQATLYDSWLNMSGSGLYNESVGQIQMLPVQQAYHDITGLQQQPGPEQQTQSLTTMSELQALQKYHLYNFPMFHSLQNFLFRPNPAQPMPGSTSWGETKLGQHDVNNTTLHLLPDQMDLQYLNYMPSAQWSPGQANQQNFNLADQTAAFPPETESIIFNRDESPPAPSSSTGVGSRWCERINPRNGMNCNRLFSRTYDLARHEDTIHNSTRRKLVCGLCTNDKSFSRNDALTRHIRVVHPCAKLAKS